MRRLFPSDLAAFGDNNLQPSTASLVTADYQNNFLGRNEILLPSRNAVPPVYVIH